MGLQKQTGTHCYAKNLKNSLAQGRVRIENCIWTPVFCFKRNSSVKLEVRDGHGNLQW
jgi:hypothetical protein